MHVSFARVWNTRVLGSSEKEKQPVWLFDCKGKSHFTYSINCNTMYFEILSATFHLWFWMCE